MEGVKKVKADKNKLQIAMARACMTTADIKKATGMPRPTLNNVIVGRSVTPVTLGRVAKALQCDVTEIIENQ